MADEKANGDPGLCPFDKKVVNQAVLEIFGSDQKGTNIPFQFPPKVTSDKKDAEFDSKSLMRHEPFKLYKGSSARALTVELEYICSDSKNFNPKKVAQIERDIKSYFYRANTGFGEVKSKPRYPKVRFRAYEVVPEGGKASSPTTGALQAAISSGLLNERNTATAQEFLDVAQGGGKADFRLMSVDISHGPELVNISGATHHLYTKISLSLELVTNIEPLKGKFGGEGADLPEDKREAIIQGGLKKISPSWL
jgi:hypothetical protein